MEYETIQQTVKTLSKIKKNDSRVILYRIKNNQVSDIAYAKVSRLLTWKADVTSLRLRISYRGEHWKYIPSEKPTQVYETYNYPYIENYKRLHDGDGFVCTEEELEEVKNRLQNRDFIINDDYKFNDRRHLKEILEKLNKNEMKMIFYEFPYHSDRPTEIKYVKLRGIQTGHYDPTYMSFLGDVLNKNWTYPNINDGIQERNCYDYKNMNWRGCKGFVFNEQELHELETKYRKQYFKQ